MNQCLSCGAPREGAVRFCKECGLDYWRAAAGEVATPAQAPEPTVAAPRSGVNPAALVLVGGLLLAVAAVLAAIVILGPGSGGSTPAAGRPTPTLSEEDALIRSFFREARSPDAAWHSGLSRPGDGGPRQRRCRVGDDPVDEPCSDQRVGPGRADHCTFVSGHPAVQSLLPTT